MPVRASSRFFRNTEFAKETPDTGVLLLTCSSYCSRATDSAAGFDLGTDLHSQLSLLLGVALSVQGAITYASAYGHVNLFK